MLPNTLCSTAGASDCRGAQKTGQKLFSRRWLITPFSVPAAGVLALAFGLLLAGCQSSQPKASETALRQWNVARAGVLGGLAKSQYQEGNLDKSRQTIDEALGMDPSNAGLHVLSARIYVEQSQLDAAEHELQETGRLDARNAEAAYLRGIIRQRWQKPLEACQFYAQAAALAPAQLSYVLAEAEMLVALDRADEGLALLQSKLSDFEHSGAIRDAIGLLLQHGGQYEKAADMFRQAMLLSPDDLGIHEHLGLALYDGRQYRQASEVLERLVQDPRYARRADLIAAIGECQLQLNHPAEGRHRLETASQLNPALPGVWLGLAKAALQCNDLKRAELSLRKSLTLDAENSEGRLLLGYLRLRQNRLGDALAAFHAAAALDANDPVSLCMVGYVLEQMGRVQEAMPYYAQALKLKPDDEMARTLMANVDLRQ